MSSALSQEQLDDFKNAFDLLDKDGDGSITSAELGTLMRSLGQNPSQDDLDQMIKDADRNGDGTIDFEEFKKMMEARMKEVSTEEALRDAFKIFDRDGDGFITIEELRQVLMNLGEKLTKEEVEEMIDCVDFTDHGRVSLEDFVRSMMS